MFWKHKSDRDSDNSHNLDSAGVVSRVGEVYAGFCDERQLIKPYSSLPCPWHFVRQCFMSDYTENYLSLPDDLKDSYQHIYRELSFFVDDDLLRDFNSALDIAAEAAAKFERELFIKKGISQPASPASFHKMMIANPSVVVQSREDIWKSLPENCPRQHRLVLFETLVYCSELFHSMDKEWVAFANLTAYRQKK